MQNLTAKTENTHHDAKASDRTGMPVPGHMSDQETAAISNAVERLEALGIDPAAAVYVDDENRLPSYARHIGTAWGGQELDDEELDYAIGWLPEVAFLNDDSPWPGSHNPYITLAHLRALAGD